ncbi:MAG: N-acetylmuramoyl-L-alanine amidase [Candidatus Tokpelaia sp.]|nr:MAG: N-acetylmuramoyl-L-alanine amidase [Candidatus Tokpelaia sp.]KAA6207606.1 MAG: N-acetylmuramoyl-L-alanine amidase [Candidatus Tokpelaia sp.]
MLRPESLKLIVLIFLFLLPTGSLAPPLAQGQEPAAASLKLVNIGFETFDEGKDKKLHIIAVFNRRPDYSLMVLDQPPRFIVTLPATQFAFAAGMDTTSRPALLRDFRYGATGAENARLVFSLRQPFHLQIIESAALATAGTPPAWRVIWEIAPATPESFQQYLNLQQADKAVALIPNNEARQNKTLSNRQQAAATGSGDSNAPLFIIVLDPGHGDFDSGAIGVNNVREKQVTLAFAQSLYRVLQTKAGIKPYLTRETDSFLRLGERVEKARRLNADLFISIHADHIDTPSLQGATIYTLSDKASDDMAKLLAEHENKADLLDGLPADEPPAVADILLDMARRETRLFSEDFARMTVAALKDSRIALIKNPHRFASFQVLKTVDIPSVLIELGYLSNPEDEKRIADPLWQDKMAHILADIIAHYAWLHGKIGVKP